MTTLEKLKEISSNIEVGGCDISEPGDYLDYDGNCIVVLRNDRREAIFLGSNDETKALAKLFSLSIDHLPRLIEMLGFVEGEIMGSGVISDYQRGKSFMAWKIKQILEGEER